MTDESTKLGREERLAAQLRANLRRRKVQARAMQTPADFASEPIPLCRHEADARDESSQTGSR